MNLKLNGYSAKGSQQEWLAFLKRLEQNRLCCLDFMTGVSTQNTPTVRFSGSGSPSDPLVATVIGVGLSGVLPGNASSLVGLTANDGAAVSYMRSDASPALDQSISPTWTGSHTFNEGAVTTVTFAGQTNLLSFYNQASSINYGFLVADATNIRLGTQISIPLILRTNSLDRVTINSTGTVSIADLAGAGNRMVVADATGLLSTQTIPTTEIPANPTANVGLTAINGTATTFMRSDAAPAIDQSIAPTWSTKHKWSITNNNPAISLLDAAYIEWRDSGDNLIGTISASNSIPYLTINNQSGGDFGIFSGTTFKFLISTSGIVTINNLSGTGNRMVIANPSGVLSTQAIPTTASGLILPTATLDIVAVDGKFEYDGLNLFFTANNARNAINAGAGIYTTDGALTSQRTITGGGFGVTWDTVGLFRITQGNSTVGATYDFNTGTDFLVFDAAHSSNLIMNPSTGLQFEYVDVVTSTPISQMSVDNKGIHFTNVQEYTDNAAAITAGLTVGYVYRTGDNLKIVH